MAAPDITSTLTGLVDTVGNQVIDATVEVLPVVAPFAIALAVLGAVAFLLQHDSYHVGQLALLRKHFGLGAMRYR